MAMANMNLIGVFVTKLWPVQALTLACGGGDGGGATKNIISQHFSNFGDIIIWHSTYTFLCILYVTWSILYVTDHWKMPAKSCILAHEVATSSNEIMN